MEEIKTETVFGVLKYTAKHPIEMFFWRWNWKSAFFAGLFRGSMYFLTHITEGWRAALGAMSVEFIFRVIHGGISGSLVQSLRKASPVWMATLFVMVLMPIYSHSVEYGLHTLNGDQNRGKSILISISFSIISALFNLFAMRRGVMITGADEDNESLWSDLKKFPRIVVDFVGFLPVRLWRFWQNS
ncbi:MAG: hypothetical protein JSS81_27205 [Acidobacteria bacterium]|nr:hypothetical protein [Acidobacteriota bacterium]